MAELCGAGRDSESGLHHWLVPAQCGDFTSGDSDGQIWATPTQAHWQVIDERSQCENLTFSDSVQSSTDYINVYSLKFYHQTKDLYISINFLLTETKHVMMHCLFIFQFMFCSLLCDDRYCCLQTRRYENPELKLFCTTVPHRVCEMIVALLGFNTT